MANIVCKSWKVVKVVKVVRVEIKKNATENVSKDQATYN